jgi:hypothetical protein
MSKFFTAPAFLAFLALLAFTGASYADLWINELHYDDAVGGVGKGVEIAGSAGVDLNDFMLWGYDGSNDKTYGSLSLFGTIPDYANGYGAVWFDWVGLQNGPDGIALYNDPARSLVQFISYEGSFTAIGGVADGVASMDIGVLETPSTPANFSLQLRGTGRAYSDFAWQSPTEETKGAINTGQSLVPEPPTAVLFGLAGALVAFLRLRQRSSGEERGCTSVTSPGRAAPPRTAPAAPGFSRWHRFGPGLRTARGLFVR